MFASFCIACAHGSVRVSKHAGRMPSLLEVFTFVFVVVCWIGPNVAGTCVDIGTPHRRLTRVWFGWVNLQGQGHHEHQQLS